MCNRCDRRLENFTRSDINSRIKSLEGIVANSVTRKTDYLICADKSGSKLVKAKTWDYYIDGTGGP